MNAVLNHGVRNTQLITTVSKICKGLRDKYQLTRLESEWLCFRQLGVIEQSVNCKPTQETAIHEPLIDMAWIRWCKDLRHEYHLMITSNR